MMPAHNFDPHLIDRLPHVRGRLTANAPLAQRTWFRVGGPAEVLFRPADRQDLIDFVRVCPADVPITVIGAASNLLIRDGGIPGVVVRLTSALSGHAIDGTIITAEAALLDAAVSDLAAAHSLTDLEFLSGIPGTIGAAILTNAGCYGSELSDVLVDATILLRDGSVVTMTPETLGLSYRHCDFPKDAMVLDVRLRGEQGDPAVIAARMADIKKMREDTQPIRARTCGSTFANPEGHKARVLIEEAGCRTLAVGGAQMSEKHCNFMINTGSATAADLENLGEEVRRRVKVHSGIELRWEIQRIGVPA